MRRLGAELGVEAMSLYKHVDDKDDILDGMIELIIGEIEVPGEGAEWREATRRRAVSAREVLGAHSWAIGLLESRTPTGPTVLRYLDVTLGNLRTAGFSIEDAVHAFWVVDSYVYGHVLQETNMPFRASDDELPPTPQPDEEYPHLTEVAEHAVRTGSSYDKEFEFGLELILEALDRTNRDHS